MGSEFPNEAVLPLDVTAAMDVCDRKVVERPESPQQSTQTESQAAGAAERDPYSVLLRILVQPAFGRPETMEAYVFPEDAPCSMPSITVPGSYNADHTEPMMTMTEQRGREKRKEAVKSISPKINRTPLIPGERKGREKKPRKISGKISVDEPAMITTDTTSYRARGRVSKSRSPLSSPHARCDVTKGSPGSKHGFKGQIME